MTYRNYKKFHEEKFLNDLKETNIRIDEKDPIFNKNISNLVNKHAPSKKRIVRGNQASVMTKRILNTHLH